jgi:DNA phosphorothioation-associated putative methyltransferase
LLVVSVMLANQNDPRGERFRDGVMTQRGTFQKYFSQSEIKAFLEQVLDEEAIPVAPGVLYVFRDKDAEQRFLVDRYRSKVNRLREPSPRLCEREQRIRLDRVAERYDAYREPLDHLWDLWLTLGRKPDKSEVDDLVVLTEGFGSLSKALRFLEERRDQAEIERAASSRVADLEVYFALNQFEQRKPYGHLERGLQQDVKHFFGDYAAAKASGMASLFQIADLAAIDQACTRRSGTWSGVAGAGAVSTTACQSRRAASGPAAGVCWMCRSALWRLPQRGPGQNPHPVRQSQPDAL